MNYEYDPINSTLIVNGNPTKLTRRENQVLAILTLRKNEKVESETLIVDIWGHDSNATIYSVREIVCRLRSKLPEDSITTIQTFSSPAGTNNGGYLLEQSPDVIFSTYKDIENK